MYCGSAINVNNLLFVSRCQLTELTILGRNYIDSRRDAQLAYKTVDGPEFFVVQLAAINQRRRNMPRKPKMNSAAGPIAHFCLVLNTPSSQPIVIDENLPEGEAMLLFNMLSAFFDRMRGEL